MPTLDKLNPSNILKIIYSFLDKKKTFNFAIDQNKITKEIHVYGSLTEIHKSPFILFSTQNSCYIVFFFNLSVIVFLSEQIANSSKKIVIRPIKTFSSEQKKLIYLFVWPWHTAVDTCLQLNNFIKPGKLYEN